MKKRLDLIMADLGYVASRSQAESLIKLGKVLVSGKPVTKPGTLVAENAIIKIDIPIQYVSRAGLKLASVAESLKLVFKNKIVLDVGSSTGGFTDFALRHGASKVIDVELGTNQLHPSLRGNPAIELYEKTDIRYVKLVRPKTLAIPKQDLNNGFTYLDQSPDIILADLSFVSLRDILPSISGLCSPKTLVVAMVKPQFEAKSSNFKHGGVIKNDTIRRQILKDFENWVRSHFKIIDKADSLVYGAKGNKERFYLLRKSEA